MTGGQAVLLSQDWVYNNILEMSDEEIITERKKIAEDTKRQQEQLAAAQPQIPGQMGELPPSGNQLPAPEEEESPEKSPEEEASDEQESQIDDVDKILKSLQDIPQDEDDTELEEMLVKNKGGRPREGLKFGTDKHPLGRDPLGHKENFKKYKKSTLSLEAKNLLQKLPYKGISKYKQIISENILSDDKIEG
jgi:hypothetical protein